MRSQQRFEEYDPADLVSIAGDGMIAHSHVQEGRMVPVAILDTRERPDIAELIRVHSHLPPGDHAIAWGEVERAIVLRINFLRPIEARVLIIIDVGTHGFIIDSALRSKAIHLQAGQPGDRMSTNRDAPRIIIELPHTGFERNWERLYVERLTQHIESLGRLSGRSAAEAAKHTIEQMRTITQVQM